MNEQRERQPTAAGSFTKTPFAHVLVYLYDKKLSGTLVVKQAPCEVAVYFYDGTPAKVRSNLDHKGLAEVLCDLGLISAPQLRACEVEKTKTGELAGHVLVRQGAIDGQALVRGVREHLLLQLVNTFGLRQGTYAFYENEDLLAGYGADEKFPLDPFLLLVAGVRAHPGAQPIHLLLGKLAGKWVSLSEPEQVRRFRFDEDERRLCAALLKGAKAVDSLMTSGEHVPRVVERTLYALLVTRQLHVDDDAPLPSTLPVPLVEDSQLTSIPPPTVGNAVDPEQEERRQRIKAKAAEIAAQNYFQMLGVDQKAPIADIKKAFFLQAKEFHPDKAKGAWAADLKETLAYIFANISEAHATLSDPNARERYEASLHRGGKGAMAGKDEPSMAEEAAVREALDGDTAFQKAVFFLRREQWDQALEQAEIAAHADPDDPEYSAMRAYLLSRKRPKDAKIDDLIDILRRSLKKRERSERINLFLAKLLARTGKHTEAKSLFEKVTSINAHNIEASREVRLYNMRQPKTAEKGKGFLGRLFDKDK